MGGKKALLDRAASRYRIAAYGRDLQIPAGYLVHSTVWRELWDVDTCSAATFSHLYHLPSRRCPAFPQHTAHRTSTALNNSAG